MRTLAGGDVVFLSGRFCATVLPGESIRTTVGAVPETQRAPGDGVVGTFETAVVGGDTAITRGRFAVRAGLAPAANEVHVVRRHRA